MIMNAMMIMVVGDGYGLGRSGGEEGEVSGAWLSSPNEESLVRGARGDCLETLLPAPSYVH